jgi:hypothetical protein
MFTLNKALFFLQLFISIALIADRAKDIDDLDACIYPSALTEPKDISTIRTMQKHLKNALKEVEDETVAAILAQCQTNFPASKDVNSNFIANRSNLFNNLLALFDPGHELFQQRFEIIALALEHDAPHERVGALENEIIKRLNPSQYLQDQENKKQLDAQIASYIPKFTKEYILSHLSINLSWTYEKLEKENTYIFPHPYKRQNEFIDLFERIKEWALNYPLVNFWYDSNFVSPDAVTRTRTQFNNVYPSLASKIVLRDIRELVTIKENPRPFAHASRYFRSDLGRAVFSYEELKSLPLDQFVLYADLGIVPLSPKELLSPMTVINLNEYGIVLSTKKGSDRSENSFHIMGNHHPELLKALKVAVIDLNIKRTSDKRGEFLGSIYSKLAGGENSAFHQIVYDSYQGFMQLLYALLNKSNQQFCGKSISSMSDEELNKCLWETYGCNPASIGFPERKVTDELLKLKIKVNRSWYFPTMQSDKFTKSHFG